jgi:hypothetical protein
VPPARVLPGQPEHQVPDRLAGPRPARSAGRVGPTPGDQLDYRWAGTIHDETEARAALHTRAGLVPAIIDRTNAEHPYQVPCVVALPIEQGYPAYLESPRYTATAPVPACGSALVLRRVVRGGVQWTPYAGS